jgi:hypothetical protein
VLDGPALLTRWIAPSDGREILGSAYIACFLPLHAAMFAIAVAWACWLRRIAVGAMAAIVTYAVILLAGQSFPTLQRFDPISVYGRLVWAARQDQRFVDLTSFGYPEMALLFLLTIAASFLIAGRSLAEYQPHRRLD